MHFWNVSFHQLLWTKIRITKLSLKTFPFSARLFNSQQTKLRLLNHFLRRGLTIWRLCWCNARMRFRSWWFRIKLRLLTSCWIINGQKWFSLGVFIVSFSESLTFQACLRQFVWRALQRELLPKPLAIDLVVFYGTALWDHFSKKKWKHWMSRSDSCSFNVFHFL